MRRSIVRGTGHYLPERVVENTWFEDKLDTTDDWIRTRTGIERRHFAADDETTSTMAIRAAEAALADAGMDRDSIDAVLVATSTPDNTFPSVATMVQAGLGIHTGFAFDIQAVCAGFVFALANADAITPDNARKLHEAIGSAKGAPVLVHCASANRAGGLLALAMVTEHGMDREAALEFGRKAGMKSTEAKVREVLDALQAGAKPGEK